MSRSLKIINMVKEKVDFNDSSSRRPIRKPPIATKETVYANRIIVEEHGELSPSSNILSNEDNSPRSSPLPPGAEEISAALSGILQDDQYVIRSYTENSPLVVQDEEYANELTPFSFELPQSYEASPIIPLNELQNVSSTRCTPIDMELEILTPMPSPLNMHQACGDEFCPNANCAALSVGSLSMNSSVRSPMTPESLGSTVTPRTTKKRLRHQNEWSDVKRKCLKNLGEKYVTKKGKMIDGKTMGAACKCRYKCSEKISNQQRVDCFTKFWKLGDRAKQWAYVINYTEKMKKKRCLNQDKPNNRKYTYKYYLPLITESNESHCEKIDVCQTMFVNTLAVSTRILKTAWKKYDGSTLVEEDGRGRHNNHKVVIDEAMKLSVCDHVRAFAPVESHYNRKNSTKLYLPGDLSIAKMFKLYLEWFTWYPEKYTSQAKTERQYRDIVNANFNISFHTPKKDQCDDCHIFRSKKNPTEQEKEAYKEHQANKQIARELKNKDKQCAIVSDGKVVSAVFDFEKVLPCPHGNISIFYYKRKLSCYNFTVYDMGKKKAVCYMWDESVAKRGANEVSSCLLDFIQANVTQGAKEFRFWSDNCAGQNRNRFVFSLYVYAAKKFNITITHRFLQKGHTQNEGDSVHSVIERASQCKTLFSPDEWRLLVRWAKIDGEPYVVRNVTQNIVFDFKRLVNDKAWMKDIQGKKIYWSKIREVHADSDYPNKLFFKYELTQLEHDIMVTRGNTRNYVQAELKHAYSEPIKIAAAKYKDLIDMCQSEVIPTEYHSFFKSLPHHVNVAETEKSDDDNSE